MKDAAASSTSRPASDEGRRSRPAEDMFVPGPGAFEVHLALGPGAQWVAESVPVRTVVRNGDVADDRLVLDVAGLAWFERLLLQLGPGGGGGAAARAHRGWRPTRSRPGRGAADR